MVNNDDDTDTGDHEMRLLLSFVLLVGSFVASGLSYAANKSVWWALLHGLLGWAYVTYHFAQHVVR